jgi:hypothetical protein
VRAGKQWGVEQVLQARRAHVSRSADTFDDSFDSLCYVLQQGTLCWGLHTSVFTNAPDTPHNKRPNTTYAISLRLQRLDFCYKQHTNLLNCLIDTAKVTSFVS